MIVAINRVAATVKGGRRFSFAALMVVGDQKGQVGFGHGKAREVPEAIRKATEAAKRSLIQVPLKEGRTFHHDGYGKWGAGKIQMRPAPPGTGVIAGGPMRAVLEALGVSDVVGKSIGSSNPYNMVRATFEALKEQFSVRQIAAKRGKKVEEIREYVDLSSLNPRERKSFLERRRAQIDKGTDIARQAAKVRQNVDRSDDAENALMHAFKSLAEGSESEKLKAINVLLKEGMEALPTRPVKGGLSQRLASIVPALLEEIFAGSALTRWAAAYTIAALRAPSKFANKVPVEKTAQLEREVLNELQSYLAERGNRLISQVEITEVKNSKGMATVQGKVSVSPFLPVELAGRLPVLDRNFLSNDRIHKLSIEITEALGNWETIDEVMGSLGTDQDPKALEKTFVVQVPVSDESVVTFVLKFDGRRLNAHRFNMKELTGASKAARH